MKCLSLSMFSSGCGGDHVLTQLGFLSNGKPNEVN